MGPSRRRGIGAYLRFNISSNPFFPIFVCFGPKIAPRVPLGRDPLIFGMIVKRVLSPTFFLRATPWLRRPCKVQPSFDISRLINSAPEKAGRESLLKRRGVPCGWGGGSGLSIFRVQAYTQFPLHLF